MSDLSNAFRVVVWLAVCALGATAQAAQFAVPRDEIVSKIKVIALVPMDIDEVVPNAEAVAARYEAAITERLKSAGFEVISASALREIRERTIATLGGLYDPITGAPYEDRIKAFDEFVGNEFTSKFKFDAVLYTRIVPRAASMGGGDLARWDGVEESSIGLTGAAGFWTSMNTGLVEGTIPALSLHVQLQDRSFKNLYGAYAGLQLLSYYRARALSAGYVDVSRAHLLTDPLRDERALELALDPLVRGPEAVKASIAARLEAEKQRKKAQRNRKPGDPQQPEPPRILPAPVDARADRAAKSDATSEQFRQQYPILAVAPVKLSDIKQRADVEQRYASLLVDALQKGGYKVVDAATVRTISDKLDAELGGTYSPTTGRPIEAKVRELRARVLAELGAAHGVTAVAYPEIVVRSASFQSGYAKWDGASENMTTSKGFLGTMFNPGAQYQGRVSALSLQVELIAGANESAYQAFGGIQPLARVTGAGFMDVPEPELFSDAARDEKAVALALKGMLEKPVGKQR